MTESPVTNKIEMVRNDRAALETIDGIVTDLFLRAENCGGAYDGWGVPVVGPG